MTTATAERQPKAGGPRAQKGIGRARQRRLAEAHVLSGYLYEHAGAESVPAASKADYQKKLILAAAEQLGWKVESRRELSAAQLGVICTLLRKMIEALGLPGPEARRDQRAAQTGEPTTAQWNQITLLTDRAYSELDWSPAHLRNWQRRSLRITSPRGPRTQAEARRVIFGLEGILKHGHRATEAQR